MVVCLLIIIIIIIIVVVIIVIIIIVIIIIIIISINMTMRDYTDGRGNVDKDSDEEDVAEQPEAFQPQYESLPAIRPSLPPDYKPSPAYNQFSMLTILLLLLLLFIPNNLQ